MPSPGDGIGAGEVLHSGNLLPYEACRQSDSVLTLAVFGADMTLSPSWSFCVDIGGMNADTAFVTIYMAGNVGSVITSLAFTYTAAHQIL